MIEILDVADRLGLKRADKKNGEVRFFDPHDTDTPDLWINPDKNQWYTFSKGQNTGGGYIDLVEHVKNIGREAARDWLAEEFSDQYGSEDKEYVNRRGAAREVLEKAVELAEDELRRNREDLYETIKERRRFDDDLMEMARIGYLSEDVCSTLHARFSNEALVDSGLFGEGDDSSVYPVLEGRIVYPYLSTGRERVVYVAGRETEDMDTGKKYKKTYTTPYNDHVLYQWRDGNGKLVVTEGFTDALSAYKAGFDVVSPATTKFKDDDIRKMVRIAEEYDEVYIINDADDAGESGAEETARLMAKNGIDPFVVRLPDGQDLDEYTTDNGYETVGKSLTATNSYVEDVVNRVKEADSGAETETAKHDLFAVIAGWRQSSRTDIWEELGGDAAVLEHELEQFKQEQDDDRSFEFMDYTVPRQGDGDGRKFSPKKLGDELMQEYNFVVLRDSEHMMVYQDGYWQGDCAEQIIKEEGARRLGHEWSSHRASETVKYIKSQSYTDRSSFQTVDDKINVENGVFDLETGELLPHSPAFNFQYKIPWRYEPGAECPAIDAFMHEIANGDKQKVKKLYQATAHAIMPTIIDEKAHAYVGRGRNGKTVKIELDKHLLGKNGDAYATKGLEDLDSNRFETHFLYGKTLMADDDLSSNRLSPSAAATFKKLTGGTDQRAEIKRKSQYSFQPYATPMFAANALPQTPDESNGFYRRWHLVHLPVDFVEDPNPDDPLQRQRRPEKELMQELTQPSEMRGFLARVIEEAQKLYEEGGFAHERDLDEKREVWQRHSEPITAFIHRFVEQGVTYTESENRAGASQRTVNEYDYDYVRRDCLQDMIKAYGKLVTGNPPSKKKIGQSLNDASFHSGTKQVSREGGMRVYSGVKLVLPDKEDAAEHGVPPFVYDFVEKKYGDSGQSVKIKSDNAGGNDDDSISVHDALMAAVQSQQGDVNVNDVIADVAEVADVDESEVEALIEELKSDGTLYEPTAGRLDAL